MADALDQLASLARYPAVYRLGRPNALTTLVWHLQTKRQMLRVAASDVEGLVRAHLARHRAPHPVSPGITMFDAVPQLRLQLAIEGIPHTTYSMCEIAAHLLWSFDSHFNRSFHEIAKKAASPKREPLSSFVAAVGDLTWYFTSREIRTEWTHYSTSFVAGATHEEPTIVVEDKRGPDSKTTVKDRAFITVADLLANARGADQAMAAIARYLIDRYVVPKVDRTEEVVAFETSADGMPRISDGRFHLRKVTMDAILREHGL